MHSVTPRAPRAQTGKAKLSTEARATPALRTLRIGDLLDLPEPEFLIEDTFFVGSFGVLAGDANTGKTALALDFALSVATGCTWQGRLTTRGVAVYVSAEGNAAMGRRVAAWFKHNRPRADARSVETFLLIPEAVNLTSSLGARKLADTIRAAGLSPALIVIDPLNEFFDGDENAAKDMAKFVRGINALRAAFPGAAVLVLQHTPKSDKTTYRGSSVLRAACDTMIVLSERDALLTLECNKQRDAERFEKLYLVRKTVPLDSGRASFVLEIADNPSHRTFADDLRLERMLDVLRKAGPGGLSLRAWMKAAGEKSRDTFPKLAKRLVDAGKVKLDRGHYVPVQ